VFEGRDRVGGRVLSAPELHGSAGPRLVLDLGGQWVGPGQTEVLRWIHELRLRLVRRGGRGRAIWDLDGHVQSGGAGLPPPPPLALADLLAGGVRAGIMARQISLDAPWQARKAAVWDRITVADWIGRHLRTPAARAYAEILVRENTAIEPRETSMLHLLFDLRSTRSARNLARAKSFPLREGAEEDAAAPNAIVIQDRQQEEWTQGCYAAFFPPGGLTSYGSAFRAPCGRIHWAGTETICEWDGHMEGALRSGKRAEMLMADAAGGHRP
jgi:monoamine oxidase